MLVHGGAKGRQRPLTCAFRRTNSTCRTHRFVRRKGSVDVRLQAAQVDFYYLIVRRWINVGVGPQQIHVGAAHFTQRCWRQLSTGPKKPRQASTPLPVACKYSSIASVKGNTLVVAPSSAPMLQMVAMPVQDRVCTPSPKYSTTQPVPPDHGVRNTMLGSGIPLTVRSPARCRITSLGDVQADSRPRRCTPMILGALSSHGRPAITSAGQRGQARLHMST